MKLSSFSKHCLLGLVLLILLLASGCASEGRDRGFYFTAQPRSDGVLIQFFNIPASTIHLSISLGDITDEQLLLHQILLWDNQVYDFVSPQNDLSVLGPQRTLLFPFAQAGNEYEVFAIIYTSLDLEEFTYHSEMVVARGGIHLANRPVLEFSSDNRTLLLSEVPRFTEELEYSSEGRYSYGVMVITNDGYAYGGGGNWDGLSFPAHEIYTSSQARYGFRGRLPVVGSLQANVMHRNLSWLVGIARTEEVHMWF
ncbi:MAG: hypothetical protein FWH12_07165 [Treponema sp.]|nr:hypothetical protein [Treponema sp.]